MAFAFAALVFIGITSGSAYADGIVLVGSNIQKLVPPLAALNLQHHGNSTTESGGVRYTANGDLDFGDISAGPHQHTVSFTDLGLARASDLSILLNINEANGGNMAPITIDSLILTAYDQSKPSSSKCCSAKVWEAVADWNYSSNNGDISVGGSGATAGPDLRRPPSKRFRSS